MTTQVLEVVQYLIDCLSRQADHVLEDCIGQLQSTQTPVNCFSLAVRPICYDLSAVFAGNCDEDEMPFFDLVPSDPTIENMRHVVCEKNQRPTITNKWHDTPVSAPAVIVFYKQLNSIYLHKTFIYVP